MNPKQIKKAFDDGKIFYEDYIKTIADLNDFNVGGVPLEFMLTSEKFAMTHCSLFSTWLCTFFENSNVVEGQAKSYKEFVNPDKKSKPGYHVWIEYTDKKDGISKVFDPVNFLIVERDCFYKLEEPKILSETPAKSASQNLITHPTTETISNKYDEYRRAVLIMLFGNFVKEDSGFFEEQLKQRFETFKTEIGYDKIIDAFKQEFNVSETKDDFAEKIDDLFYELQYATSRSDEQLFVFNLIFEQLIFLQEREKSKKKPAQPE